MSDVIINNPTYYNWHQWVGPNRKDTLGLKMAHLQKHQLALANISEGRKVLSSLTAEPEKILSRLLITGRFYFPSRHTAPPPTFSQINSNAFWIDSDTLIEKTTTIDTNAYYCWLPRHYWLSEITYDDIDNGELISISGQALIDKIAIETNQTINDWQFAKLDSVTQAETERFFIVNSRNLPIDVNHHIH